MSDHRMELLKALREHGQTLQKFAGGGDVTTLGGPTDVGQGNGSPGSGGLFGGLSDLLGTTNKFSASGAKIQQGTNTGQLNNAYTSAQQGLGDQQGFLNALQAQNGVQNQSDVYNQMGNVANGTGPNPALAMLNQQTGNNVANQAALIASQRGASANPGMMARQAAQQGGQIQQNAIGQAAALQAQQQLNALNNQSSIAQNQVGNLGAATTGYNQALQNEQQILQNANQGFNDASVGMQSNINNVNAGVAAGNQRANSGLIGGILGGVGSALGGLFAEGGEVPDNKLMPDPEKAREAWKGALEGQTFAKGWSNLKKAVGAEKEQPTKKYADGGMAQPFSVASPIMAPTMPAMAPAGPASSLGQYLGGQRPTSRSFDSSIVASNDPSNMYGSNFESGMSAAGSAFGKYLSSPSSSPPDNRSGGSGSREMFASPIAKGGNVGDQLKAGGKVPGKPKVPGKVDTEKNDTVHALLSPEEIVLPRSVTKSADPVSAAAKFVEALMEKKRRGKAA